jgi:hypothetical protein
MIGVSNNEVIVLDFPAFHVRSDLCTVLPPYHTQSSSAVEHRKIVVARETLYPLYLSSWIISVDILPLPGFSKRDSFTEETLEPLQYLLDKCKKGNYLYSRVYSRSKREITEIEDGVLLKVCHS